MKTVYSVWHYDQKAPEDDQEYEKFIGVYSTKKLAKEAIARLRDKPGFRDFPERWEIIDEFVDHVQWVGGFVTVQPGEYPP
jgi:hypothetical protein